MSCPACKHPITSLKTVPQLQRDLDKLLALRVKIYEKALVVKNKQEIDMGPVTKEGGRFYNCEEKYLLSKCSFYECWECKKPFFGGLVDCERELNIEATTKREDLLCKTCISKRIGVGQCLCKTHGHQYITWKCHLCCSEALFRCGMAYYCNRCHDGPDHKIRDCGGVDCPLGVSHPPASKD